MESQGGFQNDRSFRGLEENTMAILDNSGFSSSKISYHLNDDRLAFLEAVRVAFLLPDNGSAPSRKMCQAIFHILRDADSLVLTVESYELLLMLDKRFPRIVTSKGDESNSSPTSKKGFDVVMVEGAWHPFNFGSEGVNKKGDAKKQSKSLLDSLDFYSLVQDIGEVTKQMGSKAEETKFLKNMYLLQYLINVLECDFWPRSSTYRENSDWTLLRESLLNMLLPRKNDYKVMIKDCLCIMTELSQCSISEELSGDLPHDINGSIAFSFPGVKMSTLTVLRKLFMMVMELDICRQMADEDSLTNRAEGSRRPVIEIILDVLIYDSGHLRSFLQGCDAKQKLEVIMQYFHKYMPKSSVKTRRSRGSISTDTFDAVLKFFCNINNSKGMVKKLGSEIVQLLLANGFQAYLALLCQPMSKDVSGGAWVDVKSNSFEVCKSIVAAFSNLKGEDPDHEILECGKEALFTAATILSS